MLIIIPSDLSSLTSIAVHCQPFAFASRDFLRKTLVGKEVSFVSDYTINTSNPPREYGTISIPNGGDVAQLVIKEGWAKVREGGKRNESEAEDSLDVLKKLEDEARNATKGIWADKQKVRQAMKVELFDAADTKPSAIGSAHR